MPGRTDNSIKNRFHLIERSWNRLQRKLRKQERRNIKFTTLKDSYQTYPCDSNSDSFSNTTSIESDDEYRSTTSSSGSSSVKSDDIIPRDQILRVLNEELGGSDGNVSAINCSLIEVVNAHLEHELINKQPNGTNRDGDGLMNYKKPRL